MFDSNNNEVLFSSNRLLSIINGITAVEMGEEAHVNLNKSFVMCDGRCEYKFKTIPNIIRGSAASIMLNRYLELYDNLGEFIDNSYDPLQSYYVRAAYKIQGYIESYGTSSEIVQQCLLLELCL